MSKPKTKAPPPTTPKKAAATAHASATCTAPPGSFSEALWMAREAAKITKTEMALKLGVKPPVITKMESGRHYISEETVRRYASTLGLVPKLTLLKVRATAAAA